MEVEIRIEKWKEGLLCVGEVLWLLNVWIFIILYFLFGISSYLIIEIKIV